MDISLRTDVVGGGTPALSRSVNHGAPKRITSLTVSNQTLIDQDGDVVALPDAEEARVEVLRGLKTVAQQAGVRILGSGTSGSGSATSDDVGGDTILTVGPTAAPRPGGARDGNKLDSSSPPKGVFPFRVSGGSDYEEDSFEDMDINGEMVVGNSGSSAPPKGLSTTSTKLQVLPTLETQPQGRKDDHLPEDISALYEDDFDDFDASPMRAPSVGKLDEARKSPDVIEKTAPVIDKKSVPPDILSETSDDLEAMLADLRAPAAGSTRAPAAAATTTISSDRLEATVDGGRTQLDQTRPVLDGTQLDVDTTRQTVLNETRQVVTDLSSDTRLMGEDGVSSTGLPQEGLPTTSVQQVVFPKAPPKAADSSVGRNPLSTSSSDEGPPHKKPDHDAVGRMLREELGEDSDSDSVSAAAGYRIIEAAKKKAAPVSGAPGESSDDSFEPRGTKHAQQVDNNVDAINTWDMPDSSPGRIVFLRHAIGFFYRRKCFSS